MTREQHKNVSLRVTPAQARTHLEEERARLRVLSDLLWDEFTVQVTSGRTLEEMDDLLAVRGGVVAAINALSRALHEPWLAEGPRTREDEA